MTAEIFPRVLDQIDDSVVITNRTGVIEYVNSAYEAITSILRERNACEALIASDRGTDSVVTIGKEFVFEDSEGQWSVRADDACRLLTMRAGG